MLVYNANANIWTWALTASYTDLGKLGSKLSLILGMPPKLTSNDISSRQDEDTSLHLEVSYNYPLTEKNISTAWNTRYYKSRTQ